MKKSFSKEEKQAYFKNLREKWKQVTTTIDLEGINATIEKFHIPVSPYSFTFVLQQMKDAGFSGLPYIDMKTFKGWQTEGFQVRKGVTSQVAGVTWVAKDGEVDIENEKAHLFPKVYHLFHRSQVEEIKC